jgi:fructose-bisphosphate aldolase class 1
MWVRIPHAEQELDMTVADELQATIEQMVQRGKGILAADESQPTIAKRFASIKVEPTEENCRAYRALLFTAPGIERYISGVIEFEDTLAQADSDGTPLPEVLVQRGIVPGIKVDKGKGSLALSPGDLITYGLDGLAEPCVTTKIKARVSPNGVRCMRSVNAIPRCWVLQPTPRCWRAMRRYARTRASCLSSSRKC